LGGADWTEIASGYYAFRLTTTLAESVGDLQVLVTSETNAFHGEYLFVEVVDEDRPSYDVTDAVHLLNQVHDMIVDAQGRPMSGVAVEARPLPTPGSMATTATNGGPLVAQALTTDFLLVASASSFGADEHVGKRVRITAGPGIGQSRWVAPTHLADQIAVDEAFSPATAQGSTFVVEIPGGGSMSFDVVRAATGDDGFFVLPVRRLALYDVIIPEVRYRRELTVPDASASRLFAIA